MLPSYIYLVRGARMFSGGIGHYFALGERLKT